MPSFDTLATPTGAGPGCNLSNVGSGVSCPGVPQDPNGVGPGQIMSLSRSCLPPEPNTQGMPYDVACRERAKYFLFDAFLPFGVPDPQVRHTCLTPPQLVHFPRLSKGLVSKN